MKSADAAAAAVLRITILGERLSLVPISSEDGRSRGTLYCGTMWNIGGLSRCRSPFSVVCVVVMLTDSLRSRRSLVRVLKGSQTPFIQVFFERFMQIPFFPNANVQAGFPTVSREDVVSHVGGRLLRRFRIIIGFPETKLADDEQKPWKTRTKGTGCTHLL